MPQTGVRNRGILGLRAGALFSLVRSPFQVATFLFVGAPLEYSPHLNPPSGPSTPARSAWRFFRNGFEFLRIGSAFERTIEDNGLRMAPSDIGHGVNGAAPSAID